MGAAEGISFEEVRASKQWDTLRGQRHTRFDQWLDALEAQLPEPAPSLAQVTETVWNLGQTLTGGLTEVLVEHAHRGEHTRQQSRCPRCDRLLTARAPVQRTVETLVGLVQLARPYFSCPACRAGLSPLDEVLGLSPGRTQRDVQKAAAKLVTEVPYAEAQRWFGALTGVGVGRERMPTCTNHVAEGLTVLDVAPSRDEIERRIAEVAAGRFRRPGLVLGIDAASVPTRPECARGRRPGPGRHRAKRALWRGQWREATGLRLYLMDGERIVQVLSGPQVQNEEQLGEALKQSKEAGLIPEEQVRLCVVCDGAEWRWKHVPALVPQARQVLDYSHGQEYLPRGAKVHYGASGQALEGGEATLTRLYLGKMGLVLGGLKRMQAQSDEAAKALANCWAYLNAHRGRTASQKLCRGGSPLGSGGIESSNKCMGHVRRKRSGAWWDETTSHQRLALRCAKYNGPFDQVFARHQQRLRKA